MEMVLLAVAGIVGIIQFVCYIIILIHAFKASVGEGFLCLCVPCYVLYYAFSKFEHPQKGLILAGYFGGAVITGICYTIMMMNQPSYGGGYGTYGSGGY